MRHAITISSCECIVTQASALIIAGGQSSRMGRPKAALPFGSTTILERIAAELAGAFDDVIVVAAAREWETYPAESVLGATVASVRIVRDEIAWAGPVLALVRALEAARNETAFVCSCDLPLLRADVARMLCATIDGYDAVIPEIGGRLQPLCAAYKRSAHAAIAAAAANGERRLTSVAASLNFRRASEAEIRLVDPQLHSFLNINTPDDYARALELAGLRDAT